MLAPGGGGSDFGADDFAGDDNLDAAILLAAGGGAVISDWIVQAESLGGDAARIQALVNQILADSTGALLGKLLVELFAADVIGVTFDGEIQTRMREDNSRKFGEAFAGFGLQIVFAEGKKNIAEIDDETADGVASFENGVELL